MNRTFFNRQRSMEVQMNQEIVEFELAEDVKELILKNPDVTYSDDTIKEIILEAKSYDILKTVKTIDSPINLKSVQIVDDEFVNKEL